MKYYLDFNDKHNTFGGMLGNWSLLDEQGKFLLLSNRKHCVQHAQKLGATFRDIKYTAAGRSNKHRS
jgi:hypothetical protein